MKRTVSKSDVESWNIEDVGVWLDSVGLGCYVDMFSTHKITGEILLSEELTVQALLDIGMVPLGDRVALLDRARSAHKTHQRKQQKQKEKKPKICHIPSIFPSRNVTVAPCNTQPQRKEYTGYTASSYTPKLQAVTVQWPAPARYDAVQNALVYVLGQHLKLHLYPPSNQLLYKGLLINSKDISCKLHATSLDCVASKDEESGCIVCDRSSTGTCPFCDTNKAMFDPASGTLELSHLKFTRPGCWLLYAELHGGTLPLSDITCVAIINIHSDCTALYKAVVDRLQVDTIMSTQPQQPDPEQSVQVCIDQTYSQAKFVWRPYGGRRCGVAVRRSIDRAVRTGDCTRIRYLGIECKTDTITVDSTVVAIKTTKGNIPLSDLLLDIELLFADKVTPTQPDDMVVCDRVLTGKSGLSNTVCSLCKTGSMLPKMVWNDTDSVWMFDLKHLRILFGVHGQHSRTLWLKATVCTVGGESVLQPILVGESASRVELWQCIELWASASQVPPQSSD